MQINITSRYVIWVGSVWGPRDWSMGIGMWLRGASENSGRNFELFKKYFSSLHSYENSLSFSQDHFMV